MSELKQHLNKIKQEQEQPQNDLSVRPNFTFNDLVCKQLGAKTSTDAQGRRHYVVPGVKPLPSVTTVLSATKSQETIDGLQAWRDRVGNEEADKITREAAKRGHNLHELCENFILDTDKFAVPKFNTNGYALWKQMHPLLNRVNNIHCLEGALYSERLGIAGRVDCVAEFDGVLSIIDFKTSRKEKKEEWLGDYYMQETAYALMFSEMHNLKIKQIVTLMSMDHDMKSEQGTVYIKKAVDYVDPLLKRIKKYYTMVEN